MISAGHRSDDVWNYTPRQIEAFLFIARKRRNGEMAETLNIGLLAARGDKNAVKDKFKELQK